MLMAKRLLNASFSDSTKIVYNLFAKNPKWYDSGAKGSQKIGARIFNMIPWIFFSVLSYALGVGLPESANSKIEKLDLSAIWQGTSRFYFFKFIILGIIVFWGLLILINIIPKPNYLIRRLFEIGNLFLMILLMIVAIIPMLLGTTLGATGWVGFSIICIYGISFFVNSIQLRIQKINQELYGENLEIKLAYISKIWLIPFALIIINVFTFRIGMWGDFSFWSFVWIFAGPIYFGILTFFSVGPMKMFVSSYYFAKYSEEYRALWKVTDEQWYGKRKSQRIAKKKIKKEKKK